MSEFESSLYRKVLESHRLKGLTRKCPDDGATMASTGKMYLDKWKDNRWVVEFVCPNDNGIYRIWAPEFIKLTAQIAAEAEGD